MLKKEMIPIALGLVTAIGIVAYSISADDTEMVKEEVTIGQGETLYQVVADKVGNKNNINEVVSRALRENGIRDAGTIQPNQKITIEYKK